METEIIKVEEGGGPIISEDALQIIETRNKFFERIKEIAFKSTSVSDWKDMQGKPYLQSSGAEKIARRFGVKIVVTKMIRENRYDVDVPYYLYTVTGYAQLGKSETDRVETFGTCASNDLFFSTRKGEALPMDAVDEGNIMKSAHTNFMVRAITTLLGLRNLTWDDIAKYGITQNGKGKIDYNANANKAADTKTSQAAEKKAGKPFWKSDYQGKTYINAKVCEQLPELFLKNLGMKAGKPGFFSMIFNEKVWATMENEYATALEMQEAAKSEGGAA